MIEQFFSTYFSGSLTKLGVLFISMLPVAETRLSVPLALTAWKMGVFETFVISMIGVTIIILVLLYTLAWVINIIHRVPFLFKVWDKYIINLQRKNTSLINKYGKWGLMIFVAIPIPGTGVWSGVILGWLLGIARKDIFLYSMLGAFISIVITILLTQGIFNLYIHL